MAVILTEPVLPAKQPQRPLQWLQILHACAEEITDLMETLSWILVLCATLAVPHANGLMTLLSALRVWLTMLHPQTLWVAIATVTQDTRTAKVPLLTASSVLVVLIALHQTLPPACLRSKQLSTA